MNQQETPPQVENTAKKSASIVFLVLSDVEKKTTLTKSSIYRKMKEAKNPFPQPVPIAKGRVVWVEDEVTAWQQGVMDAR
jgi:predicted DNA-binding transcriptional regulator AlpA